MVRHEDYWRMRLLPRYGFDGFKSESGKAVGNAEYYMISTRKQSWVKCSKLSFSLDFMWNLRIIAFQHYSNDNSHGFILKVSTYCRMFRLIY